MKLKHAIGLFFHKLFDWKTIFNPITRILYPELYQYEGGVITLFVTIDNNSKIKFIDYESLYPHNR